MTTHRPTPALAALANSGSLGARKTCDDERGSPLLALPATRASWTSSSTGRTRRCRFAINDDLNQIARAWRQKHPAMTGGDCEEGDERCVEDVLVRAMESRFDARHVISNAAIHCKLPGRALS